jgi:hypothetical protein
VKAKTIQAAARKALIAANPDYYSWPPEQQEQFRATTDQKAQNRRDSVLLREVLGIACAEDKAGEIWRNWKIRAATSSNP